MVDNRHQDGSVTVGFGGVREEFVVVFFKSFDVFLLVIEDFDYSLTREHLFDVSVGFSNISLLLDEVLSRETGAVFGNQEDDDSEEYDNNHQIEVSHGHHGKAREHGEERRYGDRECSC